MAVAVRVTVGTGDGVDVVDGLEVATVVGLGVWVCEAVQEQRHDRTANTRRNEEAPEGFFFLVGRVMAAMSSGLMRSTGPRGRSGQHTEPLKCLWARRTAGHWVAGNASPSVSDHGSWP